LATNSIDNFEFPDLDGSIDLSLQSDDFWKKCLKEMLYIRMCEVKIASLKSEGLISGPVHLAAGQEAIATGVSANLNSNDHIFSAHRSHAHFLALNSDPYLLFAELFGKKTGASKGMGGSMHLWDGSNGFNGSVPIVAGTVPIALGAALAEKFRSSERIAVVYFGDGAVEEGVMHETLNLARVLEAPLLFVCENNLFSSHMHISLRQPHQLVSRFAFSNLIEFEIVDGNNLSDVTRKSSQLINKLRKSGGPAFLEAITYRHYGHVDWRIDIDVGIYRSQEDLSIWRSRDPIERLLKKLIQESIIDQKYVSELHEELDLLINNAIKKAESDPEPDMSDMMRNLFSGGKTAE
jgi:pyruvate dehydrogenase E1 component alpha subunit